MATNEINTKRVNSHKFRAMLCRAIAPPVTMLDCELDTYSDSPHPRWCFDDAVLDCGEQAVRQYRHMQMELQQLTGITPDMLRQRLEALCRDAGELARLSPRQYTEHLQSEQGRLHAENRNNRAALDPKPPRPILIKYVPLAADPGDMQTADESGQGQGQAAAEPSQARYVVVNMPYTQDGTFHHCSFASHSQGYFGVVHHWRLVSVGSLEGKPDRVHFVRSQGQHGYRFVRQVV